MLVVNQELIRDFENFLLEEISVKYSTIKNYVSQINNVFHYQTVVFNSDEELLKFLNKKIVEITKKSNVKKTLLASVKYFLFFLDKKNLVDDLQKKIPLTSKKFFKNYSYTELKNKIELLKSLHNGSFYYTLALFQLETGLRINDVLNIKKNYLDVSENNNLVINTFGKGRGVGKQYKTFIVTETAKKILSSLALNAKDEDFLFLPSQFLQKINLLLKKGEISNLECEREINKIKQTVYHNYFLALKKIGVSSHDLRRAFAVMIYERTKDLMLVKELLNHNSINTTQVYLRFYLDDKVKEEKLKILVGGGLGGA